MLIHPYCYCGKELPRYKISCGNSKCTEQYYKTKKTMWVNPWPYFPLSFIGFFVVLYPLSFTVSNNVSSIEGILIIVVSAIIPSVFSCYLHYVRQKRKGLKFPWDDKDEMSICPNCNQEVFGRPSTGELPWSHKSGVCKRQKVK